MSGTVKPSAIARDLLFKSGAIRMASLVELWTNWTSYVGGDERARPSFEVLYHTDLKEIDAAIKNRRKFCKMLSKWSDPRGFFDIEIFRQKTSGPKPTGILDVTSLDHHLDEKRQEKKWTSGPILSILWYFTVIPLLLFIVASVLGLGAVAGIFIIIFWIVKIPQEVSVLRNLRDLPRHAIPILRPLNKGLKKNLKKWDDYDLKDLAELVAELPTCQPEDSLKILAKAPNSNTSAGGKQSLTANNYAGGGGQSPSEIHAESTIKRAYKDPATGTRAEHRPTIPPAQENRTGKRTVNAKEILGDIRAGLDDSALREKYQLSEKGLDSLLGKMIDAGVLRREDLDSRPMPVESTLEVIWKCPACGKPQFREYDECPECGVIVAKFEQRLASAEPPGAKPTQPESVITSKLKQSVARVEGLKVPQIPGQQAVKAKVMEQTQAVISDLSRISFSEEIIPIDEKNIGPLKKDFVFWAVSFLGVVPLMIGTLEGNSAQISAFALFFAFVWGAILKKLVVQDSGGWMLPLASMFFTGTIGLFVLFATYAILPTFYLRLAHSQDSLVSLIGFVFQVGIWEELCKILPVLIYLYWQRRKERSIEPATLIVIGVFSGAGFAAFENMGYTKLAILKSFYLTTKFGALGLQEGLSGAIINQLVRSLSLVFCHAVWSGIFSYFVAMAVATGRRLPALFIVGLAVSAFLHGLYDWLCGTQLTAAALVAGFSFMLFYAYNSKLLLLVPPQSKCQDGAVG
jgi:RsiW-degrading membrane proteinase PrsW (M82 family)/uncharacterized Zn finger protein (UPF0148 family)